MGFIVFDIIHQYNGWTDGMPQLTL